MTLRSLPPKVYPAQCRLEARRSRQNAAETNQNVKENWVVWVAGERRIEEGHEHRETGKAFPVAGQREPARGPHPASWPSKSLSLPLHLPPPPSRLSFPAQPNFSKETILGRPSSSSSSASLQSGLHAADPLKPLSPAWTVSSALPGPQSTSDLPFIPRRHLTGLLLETVLSASKTPLSAGSLLPQFPSLPLPSLSE